MAKFLDKAKSAADAVGRGAKTATNKTKETAKKVGEGVKGTAGKTKNEIVQTLDQDGDGNIDSTDIILISLKIPGVRVDREKFLRKEFMNHCDPEVIDKAIEQTPAAAGIDPDLIEKLVDDTIKFERNAASGISAALGMPGGVAMVATIPADIAQYYGYLLRAAQKMMYLYGFPELEISEDGVNIDTATINSLTICLGIMYGVANANIAIKAMAKALATGVEKELLKKALTKGTIYPIVKSIAKWFGVRMTKKAFAGFFKKVIPVAGGIIGGGITFASFKPCCNKLRATLKDTKLSNPQYEENEDEEKLFEGIRDGVVIDVEPDELTDVSEETTDAPENEDED